MFELITLPYAPDALAPVISAETLSFHHGKHLQAYVDNLNKLIAGTALEGRSLEEIVLASAGDAPGAVFNNAGQILNHNLYFTQFRPLAGAAAEPGAGVVFGAGVEPGGGAVPGAGVVLGAGAEPGAHPVISSEAEGEVEKSMVLQQIVRQWGTLAAFQADFEAQGTTLFGSGWVWLSADKDGTLVITQESGASNPILRGLKPLLTFDVWEHAYYLDYQNRRAAHLHALWPLLDWTVVEGRYQK